MFASEEKCQWSVSRIGGDRKGKSADHNRKCPVHGLLEESPICNTSIYRCQCHHALPRHSLCDWWYGGRFTESNIADASKRGSALLTTCADSDGHSHPLWSQAGPTSSSRTIVTLAVEKNYNILPCQIQAGVGVPGRDAGMVAFVDDDAGLANSAQLSRLIRGIEWTDC